MINNVATDALNAASWAYLSDGETPAGYVAVPGVSAGAYVLDGATPPPADVARGSALSALDGEECEAVLFDGTTVERDGRTSYRYETLSSMPFRGLVAATTDGLAFDED